MPETGRQTLATTIAKLRRKMALWTAGLAALAALVTLVIVIAVQQQSKQIAGHAEPARPVDLGNGVKIEFVKIPAGEFIMGCSPGGNDCYGHEGPAHRVRISKPFEIGKYEVTQVQWTAVMGFNPSAFRGVNRPVESVSWNHAQEFLRKLNARQDGYRYRLPTEAEWEYAARAGTTGNYAGDLDAMGWYHGNSDKGTHPVGGKQPNAWGLYDMHGNVWEWCQDRYDENYYQYGPAVDPTGPLFGESRVARGSSWLDGAGDTRVSYRLWLGPSNRMPTIGFRCVREVIRAEEMSSMQDAGFRQF